MEYAPGRNNGVGQVLHAEAFQVARLELPCQSVVGRIGSEHPVLKAEGEEAGAEQFFKVLFSVAQEEYFFRGEGGEQFLQVLRIAFGGKELAGGDIKEGYSELIVSTFAGRREMYAGYEIVFCGGQCGV